MRKFEKVLDCFCNGLENVRVELLILMFTVICGFMILLHYFNAHMDVSFFSASFYKPSQWDVFTRLLDKAYWMDSENYGYVSFFKWDCVFVVVYTLLFLSFKPWLRRSHEFLVDAVGKSREFAESKKSFWDKNQRIYLALVLGTFCVDIIENTRMIQMDDLSSNVPINSGFKIILFSAVLFYLFQRAVVRYWDELRLLGQVLWNCRLSILGVLMLFVIVKLSQGRELIIYMIENENSWQQMLAFNLLLMACGWAFWYLPRLFFNDNPSQEIVNSVSIVQGRKKRRKLRRGVLLDYENWRNQFDDEQKCSLKPHYDINSVTKHALTDSSRMDKVRKYLLTNVPFLISLVFYSILATYFFDLWINADTNVNSTQQESYYLPYILGFGAVIAGGLRLAGKIPNKKWNGWKTFFWIVLGLIVLSLTAQIIMNYYSMNVCYILFIELIYILLQMCLIFTIVWMNFEILKKENEYPRYLNVIHRIILLLPLFAIIILFIYLGKYYNSNNWGIILVLLISLAYYGLYVYLASIGIVEKRQSFYLSGLIGVLIMANFIATNLDNNHLDVELQPTIKPDNRCTFEQYTDRFKSKLISYDSIANRIPVYFIASNGGGTMQAYWTARILSELQIQSQDSFGNHVFALSGASGGAVGMGVSSLLWDEGGEGMKRRLRDIYSNDFMGGTIPRLLLVDPIVSILPFNISWVTNRQEWLLKRYASALGGIDSVQWNAPFIDFWTGENKNLQPLYFANSTRAENGERYMASPVKMDSSMSVGGLFIEELAELDDSLTLTFGQCVMLTNRFPFVSNAGKIDQIGHFIDAGYHDNSGMETLMEVYRNVEKYLFQSVDSSGDTFYPVFIHINYGDAWAYKVREHKNGLQRDMNEISIPIAAGIEGVFGERIINKVDALAKVFGDTCVHQIYLPRPNDLLKYAIDSNISFDKLNLNKVRVNWVNTPLGRTITKNQMNYVDSILSMDRAIPPGNEFDNALEHLK